MKPSASPVPGKWKLINFLFLLFIVTCSLQAFPQHKTRKTVFIIADGIPADVIEKLPVPNLKAIAKGADIHVPTWVALKEHTAKRQPYLRLGITVCLRVFG